MSKLFDFYMFLIYNFSIIILIKKEGCFMENLYELTNPQKSIWLTEQYYKGTSVNNICGTAN